MVRISDRPDMTSAVYRERKAMTKLKCIITIGKHTPCKLSFVYTSHVNLYCAFNVGTHTAQYAYSSDRSCMRRR